MPESSHHSKRKAESPPRSKTLRKSPRNREEAEIEPDSYFCELCHAALDGRLPVVDEFRCRELRTIEFEHYQDLDSWRNAANEGCYFCALFWNRNTSASSRRLSFWEDFTGIRVQFSWSENDCIEGNVKPKNRNIKVRFQLKNDSCSISPDNLHICLEVLQGHEPAQRNRTLANAGTALTCLNLASSQTSTEAAWSCARTWIKRCTTSHIRCRVQHDKTWYPTRLLDIQNASNKVLLVETQKCSISGPYATLSHRWPPEFRKTLILRPETYDLFCHGVPIVDLPQTVQDSITCCRNLSIRYLWVDCMCIIQDPKDPVDWQRQASVMDKVYTHSHVNLSAVTANNTESSMFQPRDAQSFESFNGMATASVARNLGLSKRTRRYRVINPDLWKQSVRDSPLNARAWVLQERILSPRILHFGFGLLFWECCTESAMEDYPTSLPPSMTSHEGDLKNLDPGAQMERSMNANPRNRDHAVYNIWARIVEKYSSCGLTKSSDKLVALSGLAKRVSSIVDDAYVAGMWKRHLRLQLFWTTIPGAKSRPIRPKHYRAPSFSWAAIDGRISFPSLSGHGSVLAPEIMSVHLHYETADVFGAISGGHLTVRSYLYRILLSPGRSSVYIHRKAIQILRLDAYDDHKVPFEPVIYQIDAVDTFFDEGLDVFDAHFREDLYCIPRASGDWCADILILQLVNREKAHYARRGVAHISTDDLSGYDEYKRGALSKNLQTPSGHSSLHYPCIAYEEGKHTIRLI